MEDLSLHLLDILQNSIGADAKKIEIEITDSKKENLLRLKISDDGKGMSEEMLKRVHDPFFSTKGKKTGLGIPLLRQSAMECDGEFSIESMPDKGCTISATFRKDHIDRKPLGDLGSTIVAAILACPECHIRLLFRRISEERKEDIFLFDTEEIKRELEDIPITSPGVLKFIKDLLSQLKES